MKFFTKSKLQLLIKLLDLRHLFVKFVPVFIITRQELKVLLDPWYHDFEVLGLKTPQKLGIYEKNQLSKQGPLFHLISKALNLCKEAGTSLEGLDLFCADGFYSNFAMLRGATSIDAIDKDTKELEKARIITYILGKPKAINYVEGDVFNIEKHYDFAICAGGLYHISKPKELLILLRNRIKVALVIQTAYSLANTSPDFFVTPVQTRPLGCRFSYNYLLNMVREAGWTAIEVFSNQLEGNEGLEDRGSAYLLCIPSK